MELKPKEPPGDARRKLRGLVSEIQRLRAQGYSIAAIQQAFADVGINVGWTTVQRECARAAQASPESKTGNQDKPLQNKSALARRVKNPRNAIKQRRQRT